MTNKELLKNLEATHAVVSKGIIGLREIIQNDEAFTDGAKSAAQEKIKQQIGTGQELADALPDYRSFSTLISPEE